MRGFLARRILSLVAHRPHSSRKTWHRKQLRASGLKKDAARSSSPNNLQLSVSMVNVHKGILVECDPAMKQFLLYLDETMALGKKFILKDLDDTHLFILAEVVQTLQDRVGELMDQNSFAITHK